MDSTANKIDHICKQKTKRSGQRPQVIEAQNNWSGREDLNSESPGSTCDSKIQNIKRSSARRPAESKAGTYFPSEVRACNSSLSCWMPGSTSTSTR
jgi:hypothetical protein